MTFFKPIALLPGFGVSLSDFVDSADLAGFSVLEGPEGDDYLSDDEGGVVYQRLSGRRNRARSLTELVDRMGQGHYLTDDDVFGLSKEDLIDTPFPFGEDDEDETLMKEFGALGTDLVESLQQDSLIKASLFDELAGALHHICEQKIQLFSSEVNAMFEPYGLGHIKWRAKERASIAHKLGRREAKGEHILDIEDAERVINDGIGLRIELDDPSPEGVCKFLTALLEVAQNERVYIYMADNYSGRFSSPYATKEMVQRFVSELLDTTSSEIPEKGFEPWKVKKSGYTTLQFDIVVELSDGNYLRADLQACGKEVARIAFAEHLIYKLILGAYDDLVSQFPRVKDLSDRCRSWTQAEQHAYLEYTSSCFAYARNLELECITPKPKLPEQFQDEPLLDLFVLEDYYKRVVLRMG